MLIHFSIIEFSRYINIYINLNQFKYCSTSYSVLNLHILYVSKENLKLCSLPAQDSMENTHEK